MASSFFGTAEDAFDVHLGPEVDHVCGFGQLVQACSQVANGAPVSGSVKAFSRVSHTGSLSPL